MASIVKRGKSYRAQVSLYKHGKQLANRTTTFADYFDNWMYLVKINDVRETTFQNYIKASQIIRKLFQDIRLSDLNDIVVQKKIDEYAKTHSRKTTHEVVLEIKGALRDSYARGYISNDFASLLKSRGKVLPKRNKALSITDLKKLRNYLLKHPEDEFNLLVLLALETGMRRGELLAIRPESLYQSGIEVRHSISPTSADTSLKTQNAKRGVSINQEVYNLIKKIPAKDNGYIFGFSGFKQSELLSDLLAQLKIPKTTFHGLRDTHASFLFSQNIDIAYVPKDSDISIFKRLKTITSN